MSENNQIPQGAGEKDSLKPKGNFRKRPHLGFVYFIHRAATYSQC